MSWKGMPTCIFCRHNFWGWPEFNLHVAYVQCPGLRSHKAAHGDNFHQFPPPDSDVKPLLLDPEIQNCLARGSWFHILQLPRVRETLTNRCPIRDKYMLQSGYIKGHIRSKHPHVADLLSHCEKRVRALSTSRPCVWCGKDFKRRDAHLRHCLTPCMCMLIEHILHPQRPDTGEPSLHDVRHTSSLLESQLGVPGSATESHRGDAALLRPGQPRVHRGFSHGAGTGESVSTGDCGSLQTLSSARRCSQSPFPGHSPGPLLLEPRAGPSLTAVESGKAMEDTQGGRQGPHVSEGHDGDVHLGPNQAEGRGPASSSTDGGPRGAGVYVVDQESVELPALGRAGEETHVQRGCRAGGACTGDQEHRPPASAPSPGQRIAPLPLPPTSHRDLGRTGDRIHHGRWPEGRVRTGGLHTPSHSVPAVGDTDCVNEPPSGQASTLLPGQSHPGSARQAVGQMRLANSTNVCYMNAFFTAWMWSSWPIQHPALQVHAQARRGIAALLEARRPIHLLTHPVWSAILHDWQDPHSQHDVAEFALFAASALPIPCMQLNWQSRVTTDTGVEITEAGRTVTLGLDLTTMRHPDVQGLINHWSTQVITCAFSEPPSLAVLQVARFQGAGKYQGLVSCQCHILLPVFRDDTHVDTDRMPYSLQAACIHVGDQATTGHYRALLWDEGNGRFLLSDDGQCVDMLSMSAANELLSRYCYLLFYLRSTHR